MKIGKMVEFVCWKKAKNDGKLTALGFGAIRCGGKGGASTSTPGEFILEPAADFGKLNPVFSVTSLFALEIGCWRLVTLSVIEISLFEWLFVGTGGGGRLNCGGLGGGSFGRPTKRIHIVLNHIINRNRGKEARCALTAALQLINYQLDPVY